MESNRAEEIRPGQWFVTIDGQLRGVHAETAEEAIATAEARVAEEQRVIAAPENWTERVMASRRMRLAEAQQVEREAMDHLPELSDLALAVLHSCFDLASPNCAAIMREQSRRRREVAV